MIEKVPSAVVQTEELLLKRQSLLEKKVAQETEKAKGFSKEKNKRGAPGSVLQ